jgi:hypothetical protein
VLGFLELIVKFSVLRGHEFFDATSVCLSVMLYFVFGLFLLVFWLRSSSLFH